MLLIRAISRTLSDVVFLFLHLQKRDDASPSHAGDNEMKDAQRLSIAHKEHHKFNLV